MTNCAGTYLNTPTLRAVQPTHVGACVRVCVCRFVWLYLGVLVCISLYAYVSVCV